jgi:hypothetical protein
VYKGLHRIHRSEGGTRLQRTVLRPEWQLRLQENLAARAGGCARASRHRRDGSTAEGPTEPDLRVMAWRPRRCRSNPFMGSLLLDPPSCAELWGRWRAKLSSLSGAATAALGRRAPPSSICEYGRGGRGRHRSVAGLRARSCTVTECHPSSPLRCPQTHRRWLRAHRASVRLLCAAAPRGPLDHRASIAERRRSSSRAHQTQHQESATHQGRSVRGHPSGAPAYHHRAGRARMREVQQEWNPTIVSQGRAATDGKTLRISSLFFRSSISREKRTMREADLILQPRCPSHGGAPRRHLRCSERCFAAHNHRERSHRAETGSTLVGGEATPNADASAEGAVHARWCCCYRCCWRKWRWRDCWCC